MQLHIDVHLDYRLPQQTAMLLQLEAAHLPSQSVRDASLGLSPYNHSPGSSYMVGSASASGSALATGSPWAHLAEMAGDEAALSALPP